MNTTIDKDTGEHKDGYPETLGLWEAVKIIEEMIQEEEQFLDNMMDRLYSTGEIEN